MNKRTPEDIKILLDRRKELLTEINKLQKEYSAIGNILLELHNYEHPQGISIDTEIDRLQKLKEEEMKYSGAER